MQSEMAKDVEITRKGSAVDGRKISGNRSVRYQTPQRKPKVTSVTTRKK